MKVLDLRCAHEHPFEGWFASEEDYLSQRERGLVECPLCGDKEVTRLPSAPRANPAWRPCSAVSSVTIAALSPWGLRLSTIASSRHSMVWSPFRASGRPTLRAALRACLRVRTKRIPHPEVRGDSRASKDEVRGDSRASKDEVQAPTATGCVITRAQNSYASKSKPKSR